MLHRHLFKNRASCCSVAMIAMFVISCAAHGGGGKTPENDLCENAIRLSVPGSAVGFTNDATIDDEFPFCGTSITAPGVWYSVIGTGNTITATTCSEITEFDTKINVYCNSCVEPICVVGDDDNCDEFAHPEPVEWCSQAGAEYLILVHGFAMQTGGFELNVFDDDVLCAGSVDCLPKNTCPWDADGDGSVGATDLLLLLTYYGGSCEGCPFDFDGDGNVGATDLLALLVNWGPCP